MKVLLVTSHFYPENFKANDIAFELAKRGYDVTVLAPIPDYPQGHFYDGYGLFKKRVERLNGVKVVRTPVIPRHDGSAKWLAANYLSYTLLSCLHSFWIGLRSKFDAVIVHETSPVMVGLPAIIIKKIQKIPIHFWVLDLWPESVSAASNIKEGFITRCLTKLTAWIYSKSDTLLIGSKGFARSICEKGDLGDKITYFPNWIESCASTEDNSVVTLPQGFNVVIAGNIGEAQDPENIINAARLLKGCGINFIFVGDGRAKSKLEQLIQEYDLSAYVKCLGRFSPNQMPQIYSQASVLLLALKNKPIFSLTVPSRLQTYMASGKPIIAMINGEGADLIKAADCGWSIHSEDYNGLAKLIETVSKMPYNILAEKGLNGKKYAEKYFTLSNCIDHLESILSDSSK